MISKDKTYRTRDGREVRIYATDAGGMYRIHGAVKGYNDNWWTQHEWLADGRGLQFRESEFDLIEVKPRIKRTVWLSVYEDYVDLWHEKLPADLCAAANRLACVKFEIDCEEGEGL